MLFAEFIKPLGATQTELARRLGISFPRLNEVIRGKRGVTPDTALRLARVVGMSPDFWLGLQLDWDLWHALHKPMAKEISRLKPLPRKDETMDETAYLLQSPKNARRLNESVAQLRYKPPTKEGSV
jgi:addiction module HigA family antidote